MSTKDGDFTIFDLNNEINRRLSKNISKDDLEKLEELRIARYKRKEYNKKIGVQKRAITRAINKTKNKSEKRELIKDYKKLQTLPLSEIDNEANMISGKDFEYYIRDNFGEPYKIKASDLVKQKNPALFMLKKWLKRAENGQEKAAEKNNYELVEVLDRLKTNIETLTPYPKELKYSTTSELCFSSTNIQSQ